METVAPTATTPSTETKKMKLKLVTDKRANKVLFAEAGSDFVDILFNLFYMPFGPITRLVSGAGMVGCIGNLYQSFENLDEAYLQRNQKKAELLKPLSPTSDLMHPQPEPVQRKLYNCPNNHRCVTNVMNTPCPQCPKTLRSGGSSRRPLMDNEVMWLDAVSESESGVVKKFVTYMVNDDLTVTPASMISGISMIQGHVKYIDDLEHRVVEIGHHEVVELLKASLQSDAALTAVFSIKKDSSVVIEI